MAQTPHKHSKSSEIPIPIQIENRCQQKILKENSNIYKKIGFQVSREPATTGTHLGDPFHWSPWHHNARIPAVSNNYVMVAKSSGLSALKQKNIHTRLISKQHSRQTVSWTKGVFSLVNASRNAKELVAWAERKHGNPGGGWRWKQIKSR